MRGHSTAILFTIIGGNALSFTGSFWLAFTALSGQTQMVQYAAGTALGALVSGSFGFASLMLTRREVARLRGALGPGGADQGGTITTHAAWWISPVARLAESIAESWRARCDELKTRLRAVEIRHHVAEAERDHAEGILNSLRDAVLVTDAFNEITLANDQAARLLGFKLDEALHKPVDQVVADPQLRQMIKKVRSSGVPNKECHVEHRLSPSSEDDRGPSACFDVTLSAMPAPGGPAQPAAPGTQASGNAVGGVVTILRDITREKEISQMKSDFVSQASHELRTPISAINAYTEMLLDSEAQDEAGRQEFYKIIKGEAERLSRMIDNMLNISRIEAGIVSVERTEVDFVKVINEVIETMQAPAREKEITLAAKSGPLIYTAEADRDLMYQVLMNLVSNSIKYTPQGGRVTISVENDDTSRSALVTVADTGLGIPPDAIDKIFDKFYRIENYKRVAKGTGLGLNLVKHIVETVHGGKVGVTSQVGLGSKFWFTIPYEYRGAQ